LKPRLAKETFLLRSLRNKLQCRQQSARTWPTLSTS
jgi:hypothetical protein